MSEDKTKNMWRVTLLVPTAEISTSACYLVRSLMITLGSEECVQLALMGRKQAEASRLLGEAAELIKRASAVEEKPSE